VDALIEYLQSLKYVGTAGAAKGQP